jgi:hypothetical protein
MTLPQPKRKGIPWVNGEILSPNVNNPRTGRVRRITLHHAAGNIHPRNLLGMSRFANPTNPGGASCHYAIRDKEIWLGAAETVRPWTSSSAANDHEAITFELSNSTLAPDWRVSDSTINTTIRAITDIAQFYGFKAGKVRIARDRNDTGAADELIFTWHKFYSNTGCAQPYLVSVAPQIVAEVNSRLSGNAPKEFGAYVEVTQVKPEEKDLDTLAREVMAGQWGNGADRVARLAAAGYNPTIVQQRVNQIVSGNAQPQQNPTPQQPSTPTPPSSTGNTKENATNGTAAIATTVPPSNSRWLTGDEPSSWAEESWVKAIDGGVITGIGGGRFAPRGNITREQVIALFDRVGILDK